jgi:hypothetical protein
MPASPGSVREAVVKVAFKVRQKTLVGVGLVAVVLGGAGFERSISEAHSAATPINPWNNGWFLPGIAVCALGLILLVVVFVDRHMAKSPWDGWAAGFVSSVIGGVCAGVAILLVLHWFPISLINRGAPVIEDFTVGSDPPLAVVKVFEEGPAPSNECRVGAAFDRATTDSYSDFFDLDPNQTLTITLKVPPDAKVDGSARAWIECGQVHPSRGAGDSPTCNEAVLKDSEHCPLVTVARHIYVTVPAIAGLPVRSAVAALMKYGLRDKVVHVTSKRVQRGVVATVRPSHGSRVPKSSLVTLFVSTGPPKK